MNKIFILSKDENVHIIDPIIFKYSKYLQSLYQMNSKIGSFKYPIFLQKINSFFINYIVEYILYLESNNNNDKEKILLQLLKMDKTKLKTFMEVLDLLKIKKDIFICSQINE